MKNTSGLLMTFLFVLAFDLMSVVSPIDATQEKTEQKAAPATQPAQTVIREIRKTVAYLSVSYRNATGQDWIATGTCFFIIYPEARLGDNRGFLYLVTNRHVAQPEIDLGTPRNALQTKLRLNLKEPNKAAEQVMPGPRNGLFQWHFPSDESVDLAVMPISLDQQIVDTQAIPISEFATSEQIKSLAIDVGDPVIFAGFFSGFPGLQRVEPIVRQGILAMMPTEPFLTTLHKEGHLYLADVHAFNGNSGSPLFVSVGGFHHGSILMGERYLLIGVVSGYFPESAEYSVPAAQVLTGNVHDNSGVTTVVPVDELLKLLNSPDLQVSRNDEIERVKRPSN